MMRIGNQLCISIFLLLPDIRENKIYNFDFEIEGDLGIKAFKMQLSYQPLQILKFLVL